MKLKPGVKPMFCRALKVTLALQYQVKKELAKLEAQGNLEPVELGGVMNATRAVWQRKKTDLFDYALNTKSMPRSK